MFKKHFVRKEVTSKELFIHKEVMFKKHFVRKE